MPYFGHLSNVTFCSWNKHYDVFRLTVTLRGRQQILNISPMLALKKHIEYAYSTAQDIVRRGTSGKGWRDH